MVEGAALEMQKVSLCRGGSNPSISAIVCPYLLYSSLAQSVEHTAVNRVVVGSSPTGGARVFLKASFLFIWELVVLFQNFKSLLN